MYIPRALALSLLILVWIAPVGAQSPVDNEPGSFYSQPPAAALSQEAQAHLHLDPLQRPFQLDELSLPPAKPGDAGIGEYYWALLPPPQSGKRVLAQNDVTCYSMRTYRVTRDDPESDSTSPAGYSTCQPASRFQVKGANDSPRNDSQKDDLRKVVPR
jgi:hypothetical protein